MTKHERARKLVAQVEGAGGRFYLLTTTGEFGVLGKLQLTRAERRELQRHAQAIAEIVLQRARVLARAAELPASQAVN